MIFSNAENGAQFFLSVNLNYFYFYFLLSFMFENLIEKQNFQFDFLLN